MNKKIISALVAVTMAIVSSVTLTACNKTASEGDVTDVSDVELPSSEITVPSAADMFSDRDSDTSYNATPVEITLNGTTATCADSSVVINGSVITVSGKGTYEFTGTLTNGQIIVNTPSADQKKVQIVLNNANITCENSAALYVVSADKVFVTTLGESSLSTTGAFATSDDNVDGAVFSRDDVTFNGTGTLTVSATYGHGIVGKDDVKFTSGNYVITASGHGVDANDSVRIKGGTFTVTSGKDGIHCENSDDATLGYVYIEGGNFNITSGYDGIDAVSSLSVSSAEITVKAGGGSSYSASSANSAKGLKSTGNMVIYSGTVTVNSADDSMHSNGSIEIDSGTVSLSSGDDGIHADSVTLILGGTINITKSYEGIEGKSVTVKGGDISVKASDDGINAAGGNDQSSLGGRPGENSFSSDGSVFITISGGTLYVNAGGDGIDANGNLYVSGGTTVVEGPVDNGNGALDYDGVGQITGGTFVALGSSGMAMNFSAATQGTILVNMSSQQAAGSNVTLQDASGNKIVEITSTKKFNSVLISSPSVEKGSKYTLTAGTYSSSISMSALIYGSGTTMGGGNGGGFRP